MERRQLFGNPRRSLFSESPNRRKLFCEHILVCQDCGHELHTNDITTDQVCPNCGSSNRFNVIERKYSDNRRSLFSSLTNRYPNPNGEGQDDKYHSKREFRCRDCHSEFLDSAHTPNGVRCPNCGGNRVQMLGSVLPESEDEQHEYSDAFDELLREYSGKAVDSSDLQKLFAERGITETVESVCNSGYASLNDEGQICFSENADFTRRLFSELVISITKELHLVPAEDKVEDLIHSLEDRGNISPKGIILVKRAHGISPIEHRRELFSETENYIKDSGMSNDLKYEYSGETMPLKDFMKILDTQYNDAPDDILDKLVEMRIINISGNQVEIK